MESVRIWLLIEREDATQPWKFTIASQLELKRFGLDTQKGTQEPGP